MTNDEHRLFVIRHSSFGNSSFPPMFHRISTHLLIRPQDVPPSRDDLEVIGTFNPGAVRVGEKVVLLVRVAERPTEQRPGWTALPRWSAENDIAVDWVPDEHLERDDPRVACHKADRRLRLTFISHLRVAESRDGRTIDRISGPVLAPQAAFEEFGVEDPRITPLNGHFYVTYVAVSRYGPATALASTADFRIFTRHGIIFCPENKDVVLFPQRVEEKYVALHRPVGGTPFSPPQMWIARSNDLLHWGEHKHLFGGQSDWEMGRVGGGAPPIEVPQGWLEIYHGNERSTVPGVVGAYCGAAMLLDRHEPARVLRVGREPILRPELDFEQEGFVANVVFPTGVVATGDTLLIYYGASDKYVAVAEMALAEIMHAVE
jgi:predicted GH43/DUF377 family glycosyl hydrolase